MPGLGFGGIEIRPAGGPGSYRPGDGGGVLEQPTVGQFEAKPRPSTWHATTDSPSYRIPLHAGSARQAATLRWRPQGSPAGAGHQSLGFMPQARGCAAAGAGAAAASNAASPSSDKDVKTALRFIALDPPT